MTMTKTNFHKNNNGKLKFAGGMMLTTGLISAFSVRANAEAKVKVEKPNVIFILADDMGKGMISAYGQKIIKTPNMDKLVKLGVRFEMNYGCHYSAPARSSLLTGYADTHKGHWNNPGTGRYCVADTSLIAPIEAELDKTIVNLDEDDEYLADVFNKAGYYTGEIGKLDYGFLCTRKQMKRHGWDYYYGYMDHKRCHGFYPPFLFDNGKIDMIYGNTRADSGDVDFYYKGNIPFSERMDRKGKAVYSEFIFDQKISEFLDHHYDKPFFLYFPSQLPHGNVCVPAIDPSLADEDGLTTVEKEYATMVLLLDQSIGKIIDKVEKLGIADKTIIVFSSDNGHEVYYDSYRTSQSHWLSGQKVDNCKYKFRSDKVGDVFNGNMGMAGKKRSNLDGGIHVPLTFYWPGHFEPYACQELTNNYDFLATMADMLNVKINKNKTGISYLKMLTDSTARFPKDRYVLCDSKEGPAVVMNDGWKLRYDCVNGAYELYNVRTDFAEYHDVAADYPDIVKKLKKILYKNVSHTECRGIKFHGLKSEDREK